MGTKYVRMVTYLDYLLPIKSKMTIQSRGFVRSCDKLKTLYLHSHSARGHKNWQKDDLP